MLTRPPAPPSGPPNWSPVGPPPPPHHGWHPVPPFFGPRSILSPHSITKIAIAVAAVSILSHVSGGIGDLIVKVASVVCVGIVCLLAAHVAFHHHHVHSHHRGGRFGPGPKPWWRRHSPYDHYHHFHMPYPPPPPGYDTCPGSQPFSNHAKHAEDEHEEVPSDTKEGAKETFPGPFPGPPGFFFPSWSGPPQGPHPGSHFGPPPFCEGPPPPPRHLPPFGRYGPKPYWSAPPPPFGPWMMDQDYYGESVPFPPHHGQHPPMGPPPFHAPFEGPDGPAANDERDHPMGPPPFHGPPFVPGHRAGFTGPPFPPPFHHDGMPPPPGFGPRFRGRRFHRAAAFDSNF